MLCRRKSKVQPKTTTTSSTNSEDLALVGNRNINLHIFSFLSAKEIKKSSSVSKDFKNYGKYAAARSSIQYMVGSGIMIAEAVNSCALMRMAIRAEIPAEEINSSFPKKGTVKLFSSEQDAITYARFLRTADPEFDFGGGEPILQPAVFKVQYFPHNTIEQREEKLDIHPYLGSPLNLGRLPTEATVSCFETNVSNVAPISGQLNIDFYDNDQIKEYSSFVWAENKEDNNNLSLRCIML